MLDKQLVSVASDDAGLTIIKSAVPRPPIPGSYTPPTPPEGVPSLVWFCINKLYHQPDQLHVLNLRLNFRNELNDVDLYNIDPKLWATLVQLYDNLPDKLSTYEIPLNDIHLPLLQRIPPTPLFSLITILELPSCTNLNDKTISDLKILHSLTAFDASDTSLTPYALKALAATLLFCEDNNEATQGQHTGPWSLRIISLRGCKGITDEVFPHLTRFPLLSVIDVRGTRCTGAASYPPEFSAAGNEILFDPTPLHQRLSFLHQLNPALYSSPNPYALHIKALDHKTKKLIPKPKPKTETTVNVNSISRMSHPFKIDNVDRIAQHVEEPTRLMHRDIFSTSQSHPHSISKTSWIGGDKPNRKIGRWNACELGITQPHPFAAPKKLLEHPKAAARLPAAQSDHSIHANKASTSELLVDGTRSAAFVPSAVDQTHRSRRSVDDSSTPCLNADVTRNVADVRSPHPLVPSDPPNGRSTNDLQVPSVDPLLFYAIPPSEQRPARIPKTTSSPSDASFMLCRDPPSWCALSEEMCKLKAQQKKHRENPKTLAKMRSVECAEIDRTGQWGAVARQQLENMVAKRRQLHEDFGLPNPVVDAKTPGGARNPFRKTMKADEEGGSNKQLRLISTVAAPVFTQDLLDISAKETQKAAPAKELTTLKRSASTNSIPSAKRRQCTSNPPKKGVSFDWKKWERGTS